MMLNYFQIFDSSTLLFSLNWISMFLNIFMIPQMYWFWMNSKISLIFFKMQLNLWLEFKMLLVNKFNYLNLLLFITILIMIFLNNLFGLFPYIFTCTSHMSFSLYLSCSIWISFMIFGWLNNTEFMFIHLVPMNTPFILMMFMVIIETLSNLIRPLTLSIRLVANMIAGHLLLVLLGEYGSLSIYYLLFLFIQMLLLLLEMMVAFIQAYVFVILLILYMKETN
uniref:ATP synthase subunit a n=1 Tax=Pselaphanus sp. QL-2013 TaxID=1421598 RepID=A0A0A6ZL07_9HYME|nr:ATP synthase F0 subunit 6 [Pselaphanus sp. QL-2013]